MAGTRGRGNKAVSTSRSANAAPLSSGDQPVPVTSGPRTRSTRSSTAQATSTSKASKRPPPEDVHPMPKPSKNRKKNAETVDNAPFPHPHGYPPFNSPTVYPHSRPTDYSIPTTQQYVHTNRLSIQSLPPTQPPPNWTYPQPWTPQNHVPPQSTTPSIAHPHPPPYPYHFPQPGNSQTVVIDTDDFSDGEDAEIEIVEGDDGERDEPTAIQFLPPRDVLHDHWKKSTPSRTRIAPLPPGVRITNGQPIRLCDSQPTATHNASAPTHIPLVLAQPDPTQLVPVPAMPAPTRPTPIPAVPPSVIPMEPALIVPPTVAPTPPRVPLTLPALQADGPPPLQGWYPPAWQRFIEFVVTHLLHDMLFSHPFPAGPEGQKWAREAASVAFITYNRNEDILLDKESFYDHKPNIVTLAVKAARGHRGKFRDGVIKKIFESEEIGISPKMSAMLVADRVEMLSAHYRFLDAPYTGVERPIGVLFKSPVLKKAIEMLYMTQPWRDAITLPWFKDDSCEYSSVSAPDEEGYAFRPPISFVAFAAAAYQNALACLATGVQETIQFNGIDYRNTYNELYELIEGESLNPAYGETARANIQALMSRVFISNVGIRCSLPR